MEGLKISEGLRMPPRQSPDYGLSGQVSTIRYNSLAALAARNDAALAAGLRQKEGCPEEAFLYTMRSVTPKKG